MKNKKVLECTPRNELTEQDVIRLREDLEHEAKNVFSPLIDVRHFNNRLRIVIEYDEDYSPLIKARIENMISKITHLTGSAPETLTNSSTG